MESEGGVPVLPFFVFFPCCSSVFGKNETLGDVWLEAIYLLRHAKYFRHGTVFFAAEEPRPVVGWP